MPRKSIYLPDDIIGLINADDRRGFSQRIAGIIQDYSVIIAESMPTLSQSEWLLIMDMLNGCVLEGRHTQFLGSDIAESGKVDGLAEKWDVDYMALAKKVDALPVASKIAIHDVAYRFWQQHGIVENWREVLVSCGAKIKE